MNEQRKISKYSAILFTIILFVGMFSCGADEKGFSESEKKLSDDSGKGNNYQQKIIKEGYIGWQTENADQDFNKLSNFINQYKAYISELNDVKNEDGRFINMEIRVPVNSFDSLVHEISTQFKDLRVKRISSREVTLEYIDLKARVESKMEVEKRLFVLYEKAEKIKEIIEIEKEIADVRESIEEMQGRLNFLKDKTQMSVLRIEMESPVGPNILDLWVKRAIGLLFFTLIIFALIRVYKKKK